MNEFAIEVSVSNNVTCTSCGWTVSLSMFEHENEVWNVICEHVDLIHPNFVAMRFRSGPNARTQYLAQEKPPAPLDLEAVEIRTHALRLAVDSAIPGSLTKEQYMMRANDFERYIRIGHPQ